MMDDLKTAAVAWAIVAVIVGTLGGGRNETHGSQIPQYFRRLFMLGEVLMERKIVVKAG